MFYATAETMTTPPLPPTFDLNTLHLHNQSRAITPVPSNVSTTSEDYYYPSSCTSVTSTSCFTPPQYYRPHNAHQYRSYADVRHHTPSSYPHFSPEYARTLHSMAEIQPAPIETIPAKAEDSDDTMDVQSGTIEMDQAEIDAIIRNKRKVRDPKACYACHRRKVKCDRGLPCDSCVKRDHPELCSYERPTKKRRIALTAAATLRSENREGSTEALSTNSGPNITVPKEQWEKINRELSQLRAQTHIKEEKEDAASPMGDVQIASGVPSEEGDREGVHAPSNQMGTMHLGSRSVLAYMIGNRSKSAQDAASSLLEDNILPNLGLDNETTTYPFVDLWSTDSSMQDVNGLIRALPEDGLCREFWLTYRDIPCTIYPVVPDTGAFDQTLAYLLHNRAEIMRTGADIDPNRPYGVSLPWLALLFAVLASGSQSTGRPAKERELTSQVYICCSYQALRMSNFLTHPSLETIEALLIIGNALSYNMNPGVSYILLGMTLRSALSMGLHVQSQTFSEHEQYLRSRIWWALAWQDSHFSVSYDRPSSSILCTPDLPFTKHSKAGSRSYVESMCAIIRLTQEILRERSINSRTSMNWALITKYKDEVHRIWEEAMPRLRDRQQCVSMTDHLERLALRIHCSYMISEICRPVLKEDHHSLPTSNPQSNTKSPVVSPGVGTGVNPRRKSSLSASSPLSMTAGDSQSANQTMALLRAECIHYLEEVVDTYVELRSINKFAARSWVGIQRSISAAFLLGILPETRGEPRIIKLLTDLEKGIELSAREDDILNNIDGSSEMENAGANASPAWVKNMTKSLGALSNLNAALAAGKAVSNASIQAHAGSNLYQQYGNKAGSAPTYNTPAASPTNGTATVPGSAQAPTSAGSSAQQQNKMQMPHVQQTQQPRQQQQPRHASYPLVYQHNQMAAHPQHHNQYAQQSMTNAMQMPINPNQSFGPYTPDSMNGGAGSLDGGAWHYGNIQERAMEYVHPGLWG